MDDALEILGRYVNRDPVKQEYRIIDRYTDANSPGSEISETLRKIPTPTKEIEVEYLR